MIDTEAMGACYESVDDAAQLQEDEFTFQFPLHVDEVFVDSAKEKEYSAAIAYRHARDDVSRQLRNRLCQDNGISTLQLDKHTEVSFISPDTPTSQQFRVWDCAMILSIFISENKHLFAGKNVLELGCGVALPSITAALCGAKRVTATDMALAESAVEEMKRLNPPCSGAVRFQPFEWGNSSDLRTLPLPADVILCSDVIYGDEQTSSLLASALCNCCAYGSVVVSCHEVRRAGDRGGSWMKLLRGGGFTLDHPPLPETLAHISPLQEYFVLTRITRNR